MQDGQVIKDASGDSWYKERGWGKHERTVSQEEI